MAIQKIAVLTSGGDAPGMNAAIRAVVRCGLEHGWETVGVNDGFKGLIENDFRALGARDVSGIIQRGGTMLGSARCDKFRQENGRLEALKNLKENDIDALVVIGGNGSQTGAHELSKMGFPVVGIASTIDNDLVGSDITIGVDTALNVILEAIDRLKVTAASHNRAFLVEVMGRDCGYLALMAGIAGGAEAVCIPEEETTPEEVKDELTLAHDKGKARGIVVVAEGAKYNASDLAEYFRKQEARVGFELRAITLGHVQRGGTPSAYDRILASRLGAGAVEALAKGKKDVLVGMIKGKVKTTKLSKVVGKTKRPKKSLFKLAAVLDK